MASFPNREPEITRLAQDVAKGLRANGEHFPLPPTGPGEIEQALEAYNAARDAAIAASGGRGPGHGGEGPGAQHAGRDAEE
jgi:hypothetical protein